MGSEASGVESVLTEGECAARRFETSSAVISLTEWCALWVEDPLDRSIVVMAPAPEAEGTCLKLIALCNLGLEGIGQPLITAELVLLLNGAAKAWPAAASRLQWYARALERLLPPSGQAQTAAPLAAPSDEAPSTSA